VNLAEGGFRVGQFDQVRDGLRRAYETGMDSVRAVRAEGRAEDHTDEPPRPAHSPIVVTPPAPSHRDDLDVPRGLRVAAAWTWRLLLLIAALFAALWLVGKLHVVVIPLVIATLLSALLSPAVTILRNRVRMNKSLATALVLVTGLAAVGATLYLVISQFIAGSDQLIKKTSEGIQKLQTWTRNGPLHLSQQQLDSLGDDIQGLFTNNSNSLTSGALSTAGTVFEVLAGLFLVLFTTFFFLRDGRRISRFLIGLLPSATRAPLTSAADSSWVTLVSYVRATVLVAFIDAVGIGLGLVIVRVPFAFPLAALVFLGAFVPIVGATVSGAVAVLIALVTKDWVAALIVLGIVIGVQQLEGHVLQPLIMGRAVAIHPLAVITAIAAGAVLAGIVGALVAVPIVAVLNTGIRHLAALRRAQDLGLPPPVEPTAPTGPPMPSAEAV
jgi:predicted PurR-regulated permease PerM